MVTRQSKNKNKREKLDIEKLELEENIKKFPYKEAKFNVSSKKY